jgi:hypothetical protein
MLRGCAAVASGLAAGCRPAREVSSHEVASVPLFNGHDLTGWEGDTLLWLVENGIIVGRSPGISYNDFLVTTESFADFVLRLQVQLVGNVGNSGIQFRSERVSGSMEMIGYQADIGEQYWASLYDESRRRETLAAPDSALLERVLRPGDWNDYEIHANGPRMQLKLNGETTVDYTEPESDIALSGRIGLQIHSGPAMEVRFRNIEIQQL